MTFNTQINMEINANDKFYGNPKLLPQQEKNNGNEAQAALGDKNLSGVSWGKDAKGEDRINVDIEDKTFLSATTVLLSNTSSRPVYASVLNSVQNYYDSGRRKILLKLIESFKETEGLKYSHNKPIANAALRALGTLQEKLIGRFGMGQREIEELKSEVKAQLRGELPDKICEALKTQLLYELGIG